MSGQVDLHVDAVLSDLDEARFALQAGDSRSAVLHLEYALAAVESHRRGDEVVVRYEGARLIQGGARSG